MNDQNRQDVECTLFQTAFNTSSYTPVTLRGYFDDVVSGKYRKEVETIRSYVASGDKEQAVGRKKNLPLLVPGGRMEGGRRLEHLVSYSGCVVIDLDDVCGSPEELLCQAKELQYVKAGHISPSGTGLKLFVLVDCDKARHREAFDVVSRRVEADLPGVAADPSGKDANRGCFVSYDPAAFYKEEVPVVNIPVAPHKATASCVPETNPLSSYIDKFETGNPFAGGGRHSYVVKLASALNSAGFDQREVTGECLRRYTSPGFDEKEIRTTVADIYRRYHSSHGSNFQCQDQGAGKEKSLKSLKSLTPVSENSTSGDESPMGFDIDPEEGRLPHFGRGLSERLPGLLADVLKTATDDTEYDLMLLASLTILATAMPGVTGVLKKEVYSPAFYTLLIGPSGSGKGCISVLYKLIAPWQHYVYDNSRYEVDEYRKKKEAVEAEKAQRRTGKGNKTATPATDEPVPVRQKQLHMNGYITTARLIEQLEINGTYASLMYETELESINNTLMQDFGGYGYILNQAFHHERVGCASKTNGTFFVERPQLGLLVTGTPGMLLQLIPSTESGLYSRLLIYRIAGGTKYHPLDSSDDSLNSVWYFDKLGQRVLDMAVCLNSSPTFVSFTDRQRKKLDRYFEREYYNVRVFGNEDVTSVVLRHRLIIFRIAMTLTGIRKGESRNTDKAHVVSDDDFDTAFHIGTACLQHSLLVSTSLKHSNTELHHKMPDAQVKLFAAMSDEFKTADLLVEAGVRGISRAGVFRMLKKAQEYSLLVSLSVGYYQKTEKGKNI